MNKILQLQTKCSLKLHGLFIHCILKRKENTQSVGKLIPSNDKCNHQFCSFFTHVIFRSFLTWTRPSLNILIFVKNLKNARRKKIVLSSKTLPGSSLRARSLTAPPHPTLPPIPAARDLARRLDPPFPPFPPFPLFPPFPPFPPSTYLPIYLPPSTYPSTYLPI